MLVPQVVEGEGSGQLSEPQPPPSTAPPSQEEQVPALATSHKQKNQTPRQAKIGRDTEIPQSGGPPEKVGDEAVHKELGDRVERAATIVASLDAKHDSGNILKTQSTIIPNVSLSQEIGIGGSPRCQEAMGGGSCLGNIKDCSIFGDQKVEKESQKIGKEAKGKNSRDETLQDCDFDDDFDDIDDMVNEAMENVKGDIVNVGGAVNTATTRVSAASASVTTAGMRSQKAKEKGVAFRDVEESARSTTILPTIAFKDVEESARSTTILPTIDPKDKGKGIMQELEKPPKNPIKAQI
ncbi:hypothetical protein Tco_1177157 [Tanacetum coccineum]